MPFNLACFGEAAPGANGKIAAGSLDNLYRVSADDLIITKAAPFLIGLAAYAESTAGRIKLQQPSLNLDYAFSRVGLLSSDHPALGYTHMFGRPLPLVSDEKLTCETVNATDEDHIIALLLASGKITQSMLDAVNPTERITGYADQTCTAMSWTDAAMTWNQDLKKGTYAVVGMIYGYFKTSPAMPAVARLLTDNKNWRPGVVGHELQADKLEMQANPDCLMEHWPLMREVTFEHDKPPNIQVFAAEATTDHIVELLLQKIA